MVSAGELRKQREAALRDEEYEVEVLDMSTFKSEAPEPTPDVVREICCPKYTRTFNKCELGLRNHEFWHNT